MRLGDITPRAQKKLRYKWLAVPPADQTYDKTGVTKQKKLNMDVKKNTFIDQIIHHHSKKTYPIPSPCSYWLNEKLAKKYHPDNQAIMVAKVPDLKKKTNLPKADRKFILVQRGVENLPAPSKYDPKEPMTDGERKMKNKVEFLAYKKYKDHREEVKTRIKDTKTRVDERAQTVLRSLKDGIIQKNPSALPVAYRTFARFALTNPDMKPGKRVIGPKGKGFGSDGRFVADELEKYKRKITKYNANVPNDKAIDLKKDPQPGPAQYSLIAAWPGKKLKGVKKSKEEEGGRALPNIFKSMSKGPSISAYYRTFG